MKKPLIIIGIGETADIAYEYLNHDGIYEVVAFAVNEEYIKANNYHGKPVVALEKLNVIFPPTTHKVFVALSSGQLNRNREKLFNFVKKLGYECASYISPRAFVWKTAKIGENCFIFENNVIQHGVEIGNNVTLWSGNHIGHQTKLKDHVFISSHCVISGYCTVEDHSFVGVNTSVADHVIIAADNFIRPGGVILKNTEPGKIYQGNPAEPSRVDVFRFFKIKE